MSEVFDFGGYATRNDLRCIDGRTIRKDAFKQNDGGRVPLVWQHCHNDPTNVLGHAILENREDGVYAYCKFNDSEKAKAAKSSVNHGDITSLSIYANQLQQKGGNVLHGNIREVSLVLAGANPGATIDTLEVRHSADGSWENEEDIDEAIISIDEALSLMHADEPEKKEEKKEDDKEEDNKMADKTPQQIFDSMNEDQKNLLYFLVDKASKGEGPKTDDDDDEEEKEVSHNVFDNDARQGNYLSHADVETIFADAKKIGSLRDTVEKHMESGVLAHAVYDRNGNEVTYGIADIDTLFPEYRNLNNPPEFIRREDSWVTKVMNGVHHSRFARIKSSYANITMDEARARGYVKGNRKVEEVFTLLKRTTDPQTIYKKQKMDRDDIIDITDFDVVAWIKGEMRIMLDEEIARAILIGDGRLASSDDKIQESHVRPIWHEDDLYAIKVPVTAGNTSEATAKAFIKAAIRARKDYKGSGSPSLYTTEEMLTEMLLIEDQMGHMLYDSEAKLATVLRVKEIVTVPVMENQTRGNATLAGIIVNLDDYNVGADKGGEVNMFDDFDIDFNQYKYLIETRISGALTKPFSALVLEIGGTATTYTAVTTASDDNPAEEGWFEKEGILYRPTGDTTVVSGKTYYEKA